MITACESKETSPKGHRKTALSFSPVSDCLSSLSFCFFASKGFYCLQHYLNLPLVCFLTSFLKLCFHSKLFFYRLPPLPFPLLGFCTVFRVCPAFSFSMEIIHIWTNFNQSIDFSLLFIVVFTLVGLKIDSFSVLCIFVILLKIRSVGFSIFYGFFFNVK